MLASQCTDFLRHRLCIQPDASVQQVRARQSPQPSSAQHALLLLAGRQRLESGGLTVLKFTHSASHRRLHGHLHAMAPGRERSDAEEPLLGDGREPLAAPEPAPLHSLTRVSLGARGHRGSTAAALCSTAACRRTLPPAPQRPVLGPPLCSPPVQEACIQARISAPLAVGLVRALLPGRRRSALSCASLARSAEGPTANS